MKIVADAHIPYVQAYFGAYGDLILKPGRQITSNDVQDADILLVRSITRVDETLLAGTPIKFVGSVTAGADHLDTKWLDEAGIAWSVASGFNAPPVADYVVSVIAALQQKKILPSTRMKAAVIGVGQVGERVVERLKVLNFDVTLCDPVRAQQEKDFLSTPIESLTEFDLITLHVPLIKSGNHSTWHFINKEFLQRQKAGCVLLNASRGAVIHSEELIQYGSHLHWCFDVWEHEPHINKIVLEKALIATPHIAGYSLQSKIRGIDAIYHAACERGIIPFQPISPILMPKQRLTPVEDKHDWQDLILTVFNPLVITAMMRAILLPVDDCAHLFDEMRNQFNGRYEFKYTTVLDKNILEKDRALLEKLGLMVLPDASAC